MLHQVSPVSRPRWGPTQVPEGCHGCLRALNAISCPKEPGLLGEANSRPGWRTCKRNQDSRVQLKSGRRQRPPDFGAPTADSNLSTDKINALMGPSRALAPCVHQHICTHPTSLVAFGGTQAPGGDAGPRGDIRHHTVCPMRLSLGAAGGGDLRAFPRGSLEPYRARTPR